MNEVQLKTAMSTPDGKKVTGEHPGGSQGGVAFNRHATAALIGVLTTQQGLVPESLNRTVGRLNQSLNALLHDAPESLSQPDESSALQKLTQNVIARDPRLQEKVAQALSSPARLVRARDAGSALQEAFDGLPEKIKAASNAGRLISKTVCESLVSLSDSDSIGAGLERDLSSKRIYVPQERLSARAQMATQNVLSATVAYVESNQKEVLSTLSEEAPLAQSAATQGTAPAVSTAATDLTAPSGTDDVQLSKAGTEAAALSQALEQSARSETATAPDTAPSSSAAVTVPAAARQADLTAPQEKVPRAQMSTAQLMTEYLRKALEEFPEDSTYLDIFRKNATGATPGEGRNSERIREVIYNASQIAKTRNLYPGTPPQVIEEPPVEDTPELNAGNIAQPTPLKAAETGAEETAARRDPQAAIEARVNAVLNENEEETYIDALPREKPVAGREMSLSELSARAAKLRMHFSRERQRQIAEGQLPDPARMAHPFPEEEETSEQILRRTLSEENTAQLAHREPLRLPRSSTAMLAGQGQLKSTEPVGEALPKAVPEAQVSVSAAGADTDPLQAEIAASREELARLKQELAAVQAEALRSAKETVSAQLETQKELKAQAEAWYQSIREAGTLAQHTLTALKNTAQSMENLQSVKAREPLSESTALSRLQHITAEDELAIEQLDPQHGRLTPQSAARLDTPASDPVSSPEEQQAGRDPFDETLKALYEAGSGQTPAEESPSPGEKMAPLSEGPASIEESLYHFVGNAALSENADAIEVKTAPEIPREGAPAEADSPESHVTAAALKRLYTESAASETSRSADAAQNTLRSEAVPAAKDTLKAAEDSARPAPERTAPFILASGAAEAEPAPADTKPSSMTAAPAGTAAATESSGVNVKDTPPEKNGAQRSEESKVPAKTESDSEAASMKSSAGEEDAGITEAAESAEEEAPAAMTDAPLTESGTAPEPDLEEAPPEAQNAPAVNEEEPAAAPSSVTAPGSQESDTTAVTTSDTADAESVPPLTPAPLAEEGEERDLTATVTAPAALNTGEDAVSAFDPELQVDDAYHKREAFERIYQQAQVSLQNPDDEEIPAAEGSKAVTPEADSLPEDLPEDKVTLTAKTPAPERAQLMEDLMQVRPSDELEDEDTLQALRPALPDDTPVSAPDGEAATVTDELPPEEETVKPGFFSRLTSFFR